MNDVRNFIKTTSVKVKIWNNRSINHSGLSSSYLMSGCWEAAEGGKFRPPSHPPPSAYPRKSWAFPRSVDWCNLFSVFWVQLACPAETPCPRGNSLSWLVWVWRSTGSTLNLSRMTELLTVSLRDSPPTLRRKLNCSFILIVFMSKLADLCL